MYDEARRGLRGLALDAPPHLETAEGARRWTRRWSAVSQRVPRDAHQRFVKTDVLGKRHRIPGEEMPCWPSGLRIFGGTRADIEKIPPRHGGRPGERASKSPEGAGQSSVPRSCVTVNASTDARERDSIPTRSVGGESTEAPARLGRRPDRGSHTSNRRGDERIRPVT
jgi:hypothetical protein